MRSQMHQTVSLPHAIWPLNVAPKCSTVIHSGHIQYQRIDTHSPSHSRPARIDIRYVRMWVTRPCLSSLRKLLFVPSVFGKSAPKLIRRAVSCFSTAEYRSKNKMATYISLPSPYISMLMIVLLQGCKRLLLKTVGPLLSAFSSHAQWCQ